MKKLYFQISFADWQFGKCFFQAIVFLLLTLFFLMPSQNVIGQIARRSSTVISKTTTTAATITITKPSGTVAGDVLIFFYSGETIPTLSGWSLINGNTAVSALYKIAGSNEPASYTFSVGNEIAVAGMSAFSGVDTSEATPLDAQVQPLAGYSGGTIVYAHGITTLHDSAAVIMVSGVTTYYGSSFSGWGATSPAVLSEFLDRTIAGTSPWGHGVGAAWAVKPIAGNTNNGFVTPDGYLYNYNFLFALKYRPKIPAITSIAPSNGCVGATVTINGARFKEIKSVKFNGVEASFTVNSVTQITATVPVGAATGPITVTNGGGTATSSSNFMVNLSPDIPTLSTSSATNCGTQSTTLSVSMGNLNSATSWKWYTGSCGETSAGSGTSITVSPLVTTTYYARGEGGCVAPSCSSITITVNNPATWYRDADGDGFGDPKNTTSSCSSIPPTGYVSNADDCDDTQLLYADVDGDGYGAGSPVACGVANNSDCNDNDAGVHTAITYYRDADGDGFGDPKNTTSSCSSIPPAGYVSNADDCDDTQLLYADVDGDGYGAGSPVACGVANNSDCNDNDAGVHAAITYYRDADGDGFGDPRNTTSSCSSIPPTGYVSNADDCDDTQLLYADVDGDGYGAGAPVACGVANNSDCNDNDAGVHTAITYYRDADGDGFGDPKNTTSSCSSIPPAGYVSNADDCDDTQLLYADVDGDGYGAGSPVACGVANNSDCNDRNANVHPGAVEICGNGIDDNCDGRIDENCELVSMSISDVSSKEGDKGKTNFSFTVSLSKASTNTVTVYYATSNGTAIAGSDYITKSGTLTFNPGIKKQVINVQILGDKTIEPNETFTVNLSNPTNAILAKATGTGTILNDDGAVIISSISVHPDNKAVGRLVKITPNPASSILDIDLFGYTGNIIIQLMNLEGKKLKQEKLQNGVLQYVHHRINVSDVATGSYLLVVMDENGNRQTDKVIIAR